MRVRAALPLVATMVLSMAGCSSGPSPEEGGVFPSGSGQERGPGVRDNTKTNLAALRLTLAFNHASSDTAAMFFQEALDLALEVIADDSTNALPHLLAGQVHIELGNIEEADRMLTRALELHPDYETDVYVLREQSYLTLFNEAVGPLGEGKTEEAMSFLAQANMMYDRRPEAFSTLGTLHLQRGEFDEAIEAYRKAIEITEDYIDQQEDSAVVQSWREDSEMSLSNLARLLTNMGRHDEALQLQRGHAATRPDDLGAQIQLAIAYQGAGHPDSAAAIYDQVLNRPGLTLGDYFNAGVGFFGAELYDRAAEAFGEVVKRNPKIRDGFFNLAYCLYRTESWTDLRPVAEKLIELDPQGKPARQWLARTYTEGGDTVKAVEILTEMQAFAFEVTETQLQPKVVGGAILTGKIINLTLSEGTEVTVRVHFVGSGGREVGTMDATVRAPGPIDPNTEDVDLAAEVSRATLAFRAELESEEIVEGFWYEIVSPST